MAHTEAVHQCGAKAVRRARMVVEWPGVFRDGRSHAFDDVIMRAARRSIVPVPDQGGQRCQEGLRSRRHL